MKRAITALAITSALALTLTLTACGGTEAPAAVSSPAVTSSATASASPTESASPTPSGPVQLTKAAAATRYLELICRSNAARLKLNSAIDKYDASTVRPSKQTRAAAKAAAKVDTETAQALTDEGYMWPKGAAVPVAKVAAEVYDGVPVLKQIAAGERRWIDIPQFAKASDAASKVRLALGLPPRGESDDGC